MSISEAGATYRSKGSKSATFAPVEDIRKRKVTDIDGKPLGSVVSLVVDDEENRVRFIRVASGGFLGLGVAKALIPVEAIDSIGDDMIRVNQKRVKVDQAPTYDPEVVVGPYFAAVYRYYGYAPYWGSGVVPPSRRTMREVS